MTQPTAPSSTRACIIDPIVNSAPYQLISGPCSAIGSLAQRIMNFVTSIFTVIANFVKSCFCGAAAATTPPAAATSTTPPAPRAARLQGAVPVAPPGVNVVEEGKIFLAHLVNRVEHNIEKVKLEKLMLNADAGNSFLAHLLVHALVMDVASIEDLMIPFMVNRGIGSTPISFNSTIERLRAAFNELDTAAESSSSLENSRDEDSEVEHTVGETLRQVFCQRHLKGPLQDDNAIHSSSEETDEIVFENLFDSMTPRLQDDNVLHSSSERTDEDVSEDFFGSMTPPLQDDNAIHSSSEGTNEDVSGDVFDSNPENASSKANILYAQLNTLADRFADQSTNPTFVEAADAFRTEYTQSYEPW